MYKDQNGNEITTDVFNALPDAAKALYTKVSDVVSEEIQLNLAPIVARASETRSPFVDTLEKTHFFFKRQFDTKLKEDGTPKNTFGVLGFPSPVPAKIKDTQVEVTSCMIDLSELLFIAEQTGRMSELFVDGKANPALMIEFKAGTPKLY
jgi:hypothetical protein